MVRAYQFAKFGTNDAGAGHEIIAANLANADGQDLDLMRKGKKMDCAYGFCDIRQFTDTVECLQVTMLALSAVAPNFAICNEFLLLCRRRIK